MCDAIYIGNTQQTQKNNGWPFIQSPISTQEGTHFPLGQIYLNNSG